MYSISSAIASPQLYFLIGFMGSGKTYWGKRWAAKFNLPFYDLDEVIELSEGKSVAEIFDKKGEAYFREIEAKKLSELCTNVQKGIIACGGGTPCYANNMEEIKTHGVSIYLQAHSQRILDQVMLEQDKRPLLKKMNAAELLFFIEQKLTERSVFYHQAQFVFSVDEIDDNTFAAIL
ncbi:MAG: shikimate kinase [Ferruginibacter sp.]